MKDSKKMRMLTVVSFLIAVIFLTWSPCVFCQDMTVRIGWFGDPKPYIIGKAQESFDKALGVKTKWLDFPSGAAAISALGAKELDISEVGSSPAVAAMSRGVEIYQIGISGAITTSERLVAKKDILDMPSLVGKKIAYPPGSTAHYALLGALKVYNIPVAKTTLLSLKPADMLSAWKRGDIDAALSWAPFTDQMEKEGGHSLITCKDLQNHGYFVWNCFVVRKEFAEKNPDMVVKFLKVFQDNVTMYKSDPQKWSKLIAEHLNQPYESVFSSLAGADYPPYQEQLTAKWLGDSKATEEATITKVMMDVANFLVELGDLRKQDVPKSYGKFNNMTFMEKVVAGK